MTFKLTTSIPMSSIGDYLAGRVPFDNTHLQVINVLDQIMRQTPTYGKKPKTIKADGEKDDQKDAQKGGKGGGNGKGGGKGAGKKGGNKDVKKDAQEDDDEEHTGFVEVNRSWFPHAHRRMEIGSKFGRHLHAIKGVYQSVRLCQAPGKDNPNATGLALNVDVANAVFWAPNYLHHTGWELFCGHYNKYMPSVEWEKSILPVHQIDYRTGKPMYDIDRKTPIYTPSDAWKTLRLLIGYR